MLVGIPRSAFYYEYYGFIKRLFDDSGIEIIEGQDNDEMTLSKGSSLSVDEACLPVKLIAGQAAVLSDICDMVFIPRIEKDFSGRWLCPKLIGIPELLAQVSYDGKLLFTDAIDFSSRTSSESAFWETCSKMGMDYTVFNRNFDVAYRFQKKVHAGKRGIHVEAAWEFTPEARAGEIILPNVGKVLLAGHSYNVFDRFSNGHVIEKLDELGLEAVTEKDVLQNDREAAVSSLKLIKAPFWTTMVNVMGTVLCMKDQVDGIVYLSSFSCGQDPFIIELIKKYADELPIIVLKLDEHKGTAGFDTRLEAFADLLERRRIS